MITRLFAMICLVIVTAGVLRGQSSAERSALNNLERQRWDKVNSNLNKAIRKDSLSVTAWYIRSLYFFTPENPDFQIDSAYAYCIASLGLFQEAAAREREKMNRIPLDSSVLVNLRIKIDSAAFGRAMQVNTEEAYRFFMASFPYAEQNERAEELRNEVAYLDALKENTYQSFFAYFTKYPTAERAAEARRRYEKLLFTTLTSDKKVQSYEAFVRDYPASPYRQEALDKIFEISTASGAEISFINFRTRYPDSRKAKVALDILFHLQGEYAVNETLVNDSLRSIQEIDQGYLVPFLSDTHFGMMNSEGVDVLKNIGDQLPSDYLCGNITDDILLTKENIIARNGTILYSGEIDEIEELGYGFLLLTKDSCSVVVHKSGYTITTPCASNARILAGRLLAIQQESRWSLWSLAGLLLSENEFQDVKQIGQIVALQKNNLWYLKSTHSIGGLANGESLTFETPFDEVAAWSRGRIWTRRGETESVMNQNLEPIIPAAKQKISATFFGAVGISDALHSLYTNDLIKNGFFKNTKIYDPWVGVQVDTKWRLYEVASKEFLGSAYDSIGFIGPVAVGYANDSMHVHFTKEVVQPFPTTPIRFIPGKDSVSFVTIQKGDEQLLFNSRGMKLFANVYDKVQYFGDGIFMVEKKKKVGLVSSDGKILLPLEYDGMGGITKRLNIPILKSMKFGIFDTRTKKTIKPVYDKNITAYGTKYLLAYRDDAYGFINWENKPQSKFEFEEVRYWNDSMALVKKDFQWMVYEIETRTVKRKLIKDYTLIKNTPEEQIAIIHEDTAYGVISSKKGTIIPSTFSDIVNVGSSEKPLYMTEKYVEEASLFVVIYYNHEGKFLRRQAYESDDYERIYCTN